MLFLMTNRGHLIDKIQEGFLETFSLAERPEDPARAREIIEQEFLQKWLVVMRQSSFLREHQLHFTAQWLEKVADILKEVSRDYWRRGSISEEDYLEQVGNCLEFKTIPAVAALMPTELPKRNFKGTLNDPEARLEAAAKAVLNLPEQAIRHGDQSEVMSRLEAAMPVMDKHIILRKRKLAAKHVHSESPQHPLITLRLARESLDDEMQEKWTPPSSLCSDVNDDSAPSIRIFLEQGQPVVNLVNDDTLGKRFLRELEILCEGYELLN